MIRIAVDALGGDYAPQEQVKGAMIAIKNIPDIEIILYGDEEIIKPLLKNNERIKIINAPYQISMGEKDPILTIKKHRNDSSMARALSSLREEKADAVVSSGATQALIAGAFILVRRMKGFKRMAIAPVMPSVSGNPKILIDAGGNISIKPEYVLQQAYFAKVYAQEVLEIDNPVVGLINIGTEPGKGREIDREIFELFSKTDLFEFYGNMEPKTVLDPPCDIMVSDGFTANIVMKTVEGTAKGMGQILKNSLKSSLSGKIAALIGRRNLKQFKKSIDPSEIGGAVIYGLYKPVVKAQGSSKAYGFYNGIRQAAEICRKDVFEKVRKSLELNKEKSNE